MIRSVPGTLAFLMLLVLVSSPPAQVKPVKHLPADVRKAIRKAVEGNEKARERISDVGPLTRKAAEEVVKKVLGKRRFKKLKSGRHTHEVEVGGAVLEYALFVPKRYTSRRAWPLILSLHGAGGNGPGEIDFIWTRHLSDWKGLIAAPSGHPPGAQWFPAQEAFVLKVLEDVCTRAHIDTNRVYCNGFSNGGNGAWFYGENHPGRFAAMCTRGGGNPSPGLLVNLLHVPTYIIHGESDPVIKVDSDRKAAGELKKLGYEVVYTEVAGGGHKPFNEENPKVLQFFLDHPRDPWPKRLKFRVPRGKRFRNLWLEVPEGGSHGTVEAVVKENNVLEIQGARKVVLWLSDSLVDLDREVVVRLGGKEAFRGVVTRSLEALVDDVRQRCERQAPAWARLEVGGGS